MEDRLNRVPWSKLLKEARKRKFLTQEKAAEELRVAVRSIRNWEAGLHRPQPEYILRLAELYETTPEGLGLVEDSGSRQRIHVPTEEEEETQDKEPQVVLKEVERRQGDTVVHIDWGEAPHLDQFYGRLSELSELKRWIINDRCRVVAVLGFGGIGKTRLTKKLTEQIKENFEYVFWRELKNAPSLESLLQTCIPFLSNQQQIDLPENIDDQIEVLIQYLQGHRCLVILDNLESILQAGKPTSEYREGYESYAKLIQRIGERMHQSCLLLTSREKPKEVADAEGHISPVRSLHLEGVGLAEGREILKDKDLLVSSEDADTLVHTYLGNPLHLQLVSETIRDVFLSNVHAFLGKGELAVGDIYKELDIQFHRLSELEREIMYWLAIERDAVSFDDLQQDIVHPMAARVVLDALNSLKRRSLIESRGIALFTLQPVIMEYVTDRFVEQVYNEIEAEEMRLFATHALIKAQTKDYVRNSQIRFLLIPVAQKLLSTFGKEETEKKLKSLLSTLREKYPQKSSYAAGNVLNLLIHLEYDLRGYDFSHLTVWQVNLQGVMLPEVNFANADLARSVFTESRGSVLSVAFSPNGQRLAIGTTTREVQLWQVPEGIPLLTLQGHTDWIWSVAFSPDGRFLASGSQDRTIRLWEVSNGNHLKTLSGHASLIRSVAFSPDGRFLASGSDDSTVRLWKVSTGKCLNTLQGHMKPIWVVAFSPDGRLLASSSEDTNICLWEVSTGRCLNILSGGDDWIRAIAFSPDGQFLASGCDDKRIRLWEVSTGRCLNTLHGHTNLIRSVAYHPDGQLLVSSSDDHTVRLWEVSSGRCLNTWQGYSVWIYSIAFSPDGQFLASGSADKSIRLWEVSSGKLLKTLLSHMDSIRAVAFSPDGQTLASGSDDTSIRLWEISSGYYLNTLQGRSDTVWSLAFSPDGQLIASGGTDVKIHLWNVKTGQYLKTLLGHDRRIYTVAFSPDGQTLASGSEDTSIRLWAVKTGQCLNILTLEEGYNGRVYSVAFSPDGLLIASGNEDRSIHLWNVRTGQYVNTLQGHGDHIWSVAFSPDRQTLASGSEDGTIKLWDKLTGTCLKTLTSERPYERMNITNVRGLTIAQKLSLKALGAIENK